MDKKELVDKTKEQMEKSIKSLQNDMQKMRTGRASTNLLDDIRVDSYGQKMPLSKVATLATPDPRQITINPFDKNLLGTIEKAILTSGIGLTPQNDGKIVRIPIPPLSEDRRKEIAKQVKKHGEEAKVSIRHHRQESNTKAKATKDKGWSEDDIKRANDEVQKLTDFYIKKVDELCTIKEKEILTM